jgi:bifunctional UDP-N-acetylglucosamine pyrophosphorylase/glucosamine-1-phosphate N-acetyltransferase
VRVVVLAAGVGSRMRSTLPKVLHRVAGRTLLGAVLDAAAPLSASRTVVVVGRDRDRVAATLDGRDLRWAIQDPPLGTGDAVRRAREALGDGGGPIVVLAGDTPLLRSETLARLVALQREKGLAASFLTFRPPEPGDFGRVVRDRAGRPVAIVEARNCSEKQRSIAEVNAGVYCFAPEVLWRALERLGRNPVSGEFYLTDVIAGIAKAGGRIAAVEAEDWREAWGVNTRRDLAAAEALENRRSIERALDAGVTVLDPSTVRIGPRVSFASDVVVHPFVSLEGETAIAEGCEVFSFTRVADTRMEEGSAIGPHCDSEGARIGPRARVGPYSRLRPGTVLEEDVRVGNFVETKNTTLRKGVKALHLAYLGDAEVGANANIGAGVITCNYDGVNKHRTSVGEGAFVGTDSQLVAPVTVGRGAYVAAGTTVTEDVPDGALAISRAPQTNKEGWAERRKAKAKKKDSG